MLNASLVWLGDGTHVALFEACCPVPASTDSARGGSGGSFHLIVISVARDGSLSARQVALPRGMEMPDDVGFDPSGTGPGRHPPFPPGTYACPADDGSQILALLAYPNGNRVTVAFDLTGCRGVTNGDLVRSAFGYGSHPELGPKLLTELEQLVK